MPMTEPAYEYDAERIDRLIASYIQGRPLIRAFYVSPEVYRADLDRIQFRQRILVDISDRSTATSILGERASLPIAR